MTQKMTQQNNYLQHRWTPEYERHQRTAVRYNGVHTGIIGLALAATISAMIAGPSGAAWQIGLFVVALAAITAEALYSFRDRARQHERIARALRREQELFQAAAGPYTNLKDPAACFAQRCEAVLASTGDTLAPLTFEEDRVVTVNSGPQVDEDATPEPLTASRPFQRRLMSLQDQELMGDGDSDSDEDENSRPNPFGGRSGRGSPFGSRASGPSPFSSRSTGESDSSPFSNRRSRSPFGRSRSSKSNNDSDAADERGGIRRDEQDDPALMGVESSNGKSGVRFAAYYPKEVPPDVWLPVKAYAMLAYASDAVAADAENRDGVKLPTILYDRNRNTRHRIPEGASVTVVPHMPGFQFNPASVRVGFYRTWHRFDFELRATNARQDEATNGYLTFMVNGLIVADVPMSVYVDAALPRDHQPTTRRVYRKPHQSVYVSFANGNTERELAGQFEQVYDALGMYNLRDIMRMRVAGNWSSDLLPLVESADVFQLLWSADAAQSEHVAQEIAQAAARAAPTEPLSQLVRPVVWEQAAPPLPPALASITPAYMPDLVE